MEPIAPSRNSSASSIGGPSSSSSSLLSSSSSAASTGSSYHAEQNQFQNRRTMSHLHSEETVATSNVSTHHHQIANHQRLTTHHEGPNQAVQQQQAPPPTTTTTTTRRHIFGSNNKYQYGSVSLRRTSLATTTDESSSTSGSGNSNMDIPIYTTTMDGRIVPLLLTNNKASQFSNGATTSPPLTASNSSSLPQQHQQTYYHHETPSSLFEKYHHQQQHHPEDLLLLSTTNTTIPDGGDNTTTPRFSHNLNYNNVHETRHAQSLLLGFAFCAVWSSSNIMAPQLTQMAIDFGFGNNTTNDYNHTTTAAVLLNDQDENTTTIDYYYYQQQQQQQQQQRYNNTIHHDDADRDLYLGSYIALAVSVCSFPIAGMIGIATDLVHNYRKALFCTTVLAAALATLATSYCRNYTELLLARWITGGLVAGTVPVAFSFLGDLFDVNERNAASSGLTAMMGMGIITGQVYSGYTDWRTAFRASGIGTAILAMLCFWLVIDPIRGGKEKAIQDLLAAGTTYERKLTLQNFAKAIRNNASNSILLWQGFFSSLPWGVIFVFLNDYLSQERGFSVPDATYLVAVFGVGCAAGGILGGWIGQVLFDLRRSYLPLFMAITTVLGIIPFVILLNSSFTNAHGLWGFACAGMGGLVASLPSVNVRPCLLNVNPPETRGASLTAANLLINVGRGVGPSCITLIQAIFQVDRKFAFNVTMILFWTISGIQLLLLMETLPQDQDAMEAELDSYVRNTMTTDLDDSLMSISVSIEDRRTFFDMNAAREAVEYVRQGIQELCPPSLRCDGENEEKWSESSLWMDETEEDTPLVV